MGMIVSLYDVKYVPTAPTRLILPAPGLAQAESEPQSAFVLKEQIEPLDPLIFGRRCPLDLIHILVPAVTGNRDVTEVLLHYMDVTG